jgi:hypothetical protein
LIAAGNRALGRLLALAQFQSAYDVFVHLFAEVVRRPEPWASPVFVREVERLSEFVWRLAAVRGASEVIVAFQKFVQDCGARAGSKGISSSVAIFEAYNRAIALEDVDLADVQALPIAGGDERTRAFLENMRSYALNVSLIRKHAFVLECLEAFPLGEGRDLESLARQLRSPVSSPGFDLFEFLVSDQCVRVWSRTGAIEQGVQQLEAAAQRLKALEDSFGSDDLLEGTLWSLAQALTRLAALDLVARGGEYFLLAMPRAVAAVQRALDLEGVPPAAGQKLLENAIDKTREALEDAELLQELCGVLLGKVCLLNASLRLSVALSGRDQSEASDGIAELWRRAKGEAESLRCQHLAMGALAARASVKHGVETCASCLKVLVEEVIREELDGPARQIVPQLAELALLLGDRRMYRASADALGYLTAKPAPPAGTSAFLEWCEAKMSRGQFLRLLRLPRACLDEVLDCAQIDTELYDQTLKPRAWRLQLDGRLQACWCYEQLEDWDELDRVLEASISIGGIEEWRGYPHFVGICFRREIACKRSSQEAIDKALDRVGAPHYRSHYETAAIMRLLGQTMAECVASPVADSTRTRVCLAARDQVGQLTEWVGLDAAVDFLDVYLRLDQTHGESAELLYETLLAKHAASAHKLEELETNLQGGKIRPLLEFILRRFASRIVWNDQPAGQVRGILEQIKISGLCSLSAQQIEFCVEHGQHVHVAEGRIVLHAGLLVLRALQEQDEGVQSNDQLMASATEAIWAATRMALRLLATENVVHPKLARAMKAYLEVCDAFAPAGRLSIQPLGV